MRLKAHLAKACLAAVPALLGLGLTAPALAAEKVTWNWALFGTPRAFTSGLEHVSKAVAERSGGQFKIRLAYGESLGTAKDFLDGLKVESFEGAMVTIAYSPGKAPLHGALDLPFLPIANLDVMEKTYEAFYAYPPAREELKRWNAQAYLGLLLQQNEFMGNGEPPRKLEDWKGMRVRALAGMGEAMRHLGAIPTSVPAPEVYTALERGVFQAISFPFSYAFGAYKLHEISKWYTYGMQMGTTHAVLAVSATAWARLPAEYRKLLEDAKAEAYATVKAVYLAEDKKWIPLYDKRLTRITIAPDQVKEFREKAAKPVWEKWVEENTGKGLPARQALDLVLETAQKAAGS